MRRSFRWGALGLSWLFPTAPSFAQAPAPPASTAPSMPAANQGQWVPAPDGRYVWVPPGYQPPPVLPYHEGDPVPPGYHLEERPIRPAIITGAVVTAVPYFTGLLLAATHNFPNRTYFLAVPWAGPWLTLAFRENRCETTSSSDPADCFEDAAVGFALIFDGLVQDSGGVLILVGYLAAKTKLVRNTSPVSFTVQRLGAGYGVSAFGTF